MKKYLPRILDKQLQEALSYRGAVLIEGAKHVGKTLTARQFSNSELLLDVDVDDKMSATVNPAVALNRDPPLLIDEWQLVPNIWNHVRRQCDERREPGQFILTGSARPTHSITRHSGAGRITRLKLRPMTLAEQEISNSSIPMSDLLNGVPLTGMKPSVSFDELLDAICRGGWPAHISLDMRQHLIEVQAYLDEITRLDLLEEANFDPVRMERLLKSIARNISTEASLTTLRKDVNSSMQTRTIKKYLDRLQQIHIVEYLNPWAAHLRTRSQLRITPKLLFCDPSLAVAALQASPARIRADMQYYGLLFESLVVRDLLVYAQENDAHVSFYRDNTGLEIDAIVETRMGTWMPIEIKLGGAQHVEEAAKALLRLERKVDTDKRGKPAAKLVITATPVFPYTRPDGVSVLSIASLGP